MVNLNQFLEPLAKEFRTMGIPEPIVQGSTACILFLDAVLGLKLGMAI